MVDYNGEYDSYINGRFNALFGRDAAAGGLDYWGRSLSDPTSGITKSNFDQSLINGASGADLDYYNNSLITDSFQDLFGRDPAQGGLDYYSDALNDPTSGVNYGNLTDTILNGASLYDQVSNNDIANGGDGIYTDTTGTTDITTPSSSNDNVLGWINDLSAGVPNYFDAYDDYANLSSEIEGWMQNAINRQRTTADQVTSAMNAVANQRAGSGIMGGTEATNLNASVMADLARIFAENATNIDMAGRQMQATAISGLPSAAMMPVNSMMNLYSINAADQQNWANIAANLLSGGY